MKVIVFFYKKNFSFSSFVVVRDLELEGSLSHAVTLPVSQTIHIQVDIISSPSTEITNEFEDTPSTSNCHESSSSTNKLV
jgi:hypothetical protein